MKGLDAGRSVVEEGDMVVAQLQRVLTPPIGASDAGPRHQPLGEGPPDVNPS
jgi:hypothetical protein